MLGLLFISFSLHLCTVNTLELQPIILVADSTHEIDFNSSSQALCFQVPEAIDWPIYMLRDLHVILNVKVYDAGYHKDFQPVSQIITLTVQESHLHRVSAENMDSNSFCSSARRIQSKSPFSFLSSFFYSSLSDTSQKLTNLNDAHLTFPSFPTPCVFVCRSTTQSTTPLRLTVNVTSEFNDLSVIQCAVGVLCLLSADYLSHSISFYYLTGVGFAVFGSLLIVVILFIRMLPLHRSGTVLQGILLLLGSAFSLSCMLLEYMRSTVFELIAANAEYTALYVILVACFSFVLFYWFHIPDILVHKYPRTTVIMKYALRITGAALIIWSLHLPFDEVTFLNTFISSVSSQLHSNITSTMMASRILSSYAPKVVKVLLTCGLVLFVDVLKWMHVSPAAYNRSKHKHGFLPPITKGDNCYGTFRPGSPWASSSPYNGLPESKHICSRHSRKSGYFAENLDSFPVRHRQSVTTRHTPQNCVDRKSFSRYNSDSLYRNDSSYDLLTDDEEY